MTTDDREDTLAITRVPYLYCFIICHPFETPQKPFLVKLAQDPFRSVAQHNQQLSRAVDLAAAAPFCYLQSIAGPFRTDDRAKRFSEELVHGTRGKPSICRRIEELAGAYGVPCYSADCELTEPTSDFLRRHGLATEFMELADLFEEACAVLL